MTDNWDDPEWDDPPTTGYASINPWWVGLVVLAMIGGALLFWRAVLGS